MTATITNDRPEMQLIRPSGVHTGTRRKALRTPTHRPSGASESGTSIASSFHEPSPDHRSRARTILLAASILIVALNLRATILAVSPLLDAIRDDTGISNTLAGLLTTLPVVLFGLLASLAPRLGHRFGTDRVIAATMTVLAAGILLRLAHPIPFLFLGTAVAGAAIAIANVLMPAIVKRDFPGQMGLMTGLYTMGISAGGAFGAGLTLPVARAAGLEWRGALAIWAVPALFAIAFLTVRLMMPNGRDRPGRSAATRRPPTPSLWRDPLAWRVSLFMGLQSFIFFAVSSWTPTLLMDNGMTEARAGLMLSLMNIFGLVASFVAPIVANRARDQRALVAVVVAIWAAGIGGLLIAPATWTIFWMALFGIAAGSALSIALTLIVLRSPDTPHAAALSGMAQSVGYLLAATGPFIVGALHDLSGGWRVPVTFVLLILVPTLLFGFAAGRDRLVGQATARGTTQADTRIDRTG